MKYIFVMNLEYLIIGCVSLKWSHLHIFSSFIMYVPLFIVYFPRMALKAQVDSYILYQKNIDAWCQTWIWGPQWGSLRLNTSTLGLAWRHASLVQQQWNLILPGYVLWEKALAADSPVFQCSESIGGTLGNTRWTGSLKQYVAIFHLWGTAILEQYWASSYKWKRGISLPSNYPQNKISSWNKGRGP